MLDDEDDGWHKKGFGVYPTLINRAGPDVGRAQENAMAFGITWPQGCQTVEFENHDGTITAYRTHGGMPQVTTSEPVIEAPVCIIEELLSPLTETSYAARTYHADDRIFSNNGLYSIPLKPINRITVTTGDVVPQTRAICLSQNDSTTGVRVNDTDLVESSRTYSTASYYQRVYINGTFIPCAFDARLTDIAFAGKCGRPLTLKVYPTGGTSGTHGSVFGDHVLGSATITSYRVMGLNAKTAVTSKKMEIVLASPGKFFERIENAAWTVLNNLTTPAPNAPFPWDRRLKSFAGLKCFQRVNGNLYTDQTLTTLLDASLRPASFQADTEFGPRYFKFTSNADYTLPATNWKFPGDAIFPRKMFCFPEAVYSARVNPFRLLPSEHIFKCAAGQVWKIGVTLTTGSGATDNYKIYLRNRFDPILESVSTVNLLLAEVNAKNWSAYHGIDIPSMPPSPSPIPTAAPTLRPTSMAFVSRPDGREAYLIAYWEDVFLFPTSDRTRTLTSVIHLVFSESGSSDPLSGTGITATASEYEVFKDFVDERENTIDVVGVETGGWTGEGLTTIGSCGPLSLYLFSNQYIFTGKTVTTNDYAQLSYKKLLWIYVGHEGVFDFLTYDYYYLSTFDVNYVSNSGEVNRTRTEFCISPDGDGMKGYNGVRSGAVRTQHTDGYGIHDHWAAITSSVRGELISKRGILRESNTAIDISTDMNASWTWPPTGEPEGVVTDVRTGTTTTAFYGGLHASGSTTLTYVLGHDPYYTGTLYSVNDISLTGGAAWHTLDLIFNTSIDEVSQPSSTIQATDKIYHGYVIPRDTQIQRVSIDPRAGVAHIAAADADAGHFY